jgi:hypothetical protein
MLENAICWREHYVKEHGVFGVHNVAETTSREFAKPIRTGLRGGDTLKGLNSMRP